MASKQQIAYNQRRELLAKQKAEKDKNTIHINFGERLPDELRDSPVKNSNIVNTEPNDIYDKMYNKRLASKLNDMGVYSIKQLSELKLDKFSIFEKVQIKLLINYF